MNAKLIFVLTLFAALAAALLALGSHAMQDARPTVLVQLNMSTEDYMLAVERACPEVNIRWFNSYRMGEANYAMMQEAGAMPDILFRTNFENDPQASRYLRDLSSEAVVSGYAPAVIDSFRTESGRVYWLPVQAAAYGTLANRALFERYDIPLPTDYDSFLDALAAFEAVGVRGFARALGPRVWQAENYTALMECAPALFTSVDARLWRKAYAQGENDPDSPFWPQVFEQFLLAKADGVLREGDRLAYKQDVNDGFLRGDIAMQMSTSNNVRAMQASGLDVVMLPVFSRGGSFTLLSVGMSLGVSKTVSDERLPVVLSVLKAMTSPEAFEACARAQGGLIDLTSGGNTSLEPAMAPLSDSLERGAASVIAYDLALCTASAAATDALLAPGGTAAQAQLAFDGALDDVRAMAAGQSPQPEAVAATLLGDYPAHAVPGEGVPASSALANTLLPLLEDVDILLMNANLARMPIRSGDYTARQLDMLLDTPRALHRRTMTVQALIDAINRDLCCAHRVSAMLPVMAGAQYRVSVYEDGTDILPIDMTGVTRYAQSRPRFLCTDILMNGRPLPKDRQITLAASRMEMFYLSVLDVTDSSRFEGYELMDAMDKPLLLDHLTGGGKLEKPTPYVILSPAFPQR